MLFVKGVRVVPGLPFPAKDQVMLVEKVPVPKTVAVKSCWYPFVIVMVFGLMLIPVMA